MAADDAGVVDERVDAALVGFDVGDRALDGVVVGHVDLDEAHAEPSGGVLPALRVACSEEDCLAELGEAAGSLVAEALVRSSDEGDGGHESSIVRRAGDSQGCLDGRKACTAFGRPLAGIMNS